MSSRRTRSYSGCWTCQRRRRKCDGDRPSCRICCERNIPCEGYQVRSRWDTGIASRGRFTGAEKPTDESVLPRSPSRQRNTQKTESRFPPPVAELAWSPIDKPLPQPPPVINGRRDGTLKEQALFQKCSFYCPFQIRFACGSACCHEERLAACFFLRYEPKQINY